MSQVEEVDARNNPDEETERKTEGKVDSKELTSLVTKLLARSTIKISLEDILADIELHPGATLALKKMEENGHEPEVFSDGTSWKIITATKNPPTMDWQVFHRDHSSDNLANYNLALQTAQSQGLKLMTKEEHQMFLKTKRIAEWRMLLGDSLKDGKPLIYDSTFRTKYLHTNYPDRQNYYCWRGVLEVPKTIETKVSIGQQIKRLFVTS